MADETKPIIPAPEGLDDFLVADDPQAAMAAPGFGQLGQMAMQSEPVQNIVTGKGLDDYHQMLQAAMAGDEEAQKALAQHQAGIAAGSLKFAPEAAPGTIQKLENAIGGRAMTKPQLADEAVKAAEAGIPGVGQKEVAMATQKLNTPNPVRYTGRPKRMAEGGAVPDMAEPAVPEGLDAFIAPEMREEKYGTPTEIAKTAVEGLGQGIAGPLAPMAERALGVDPAGIRARQEVNPGTHYASEAAGLAGGLLTGSGEAGLALKAGEIGSKALGVAEGASTIAKVGSAALKGSIENMIIQGGDEASKMVLQDPNQSAETAITDIGLAAALGGGLTGALSGAGALWKATRGNDVHHLLDSMVSKLGGIEGTESNTIDAAIKNSGLKVSPEVRAGMANDPAARQAFQLLQESQTSSGMKAQSAVKEFRKDATDSIVQTLGKSPDDIASLGSLSEYDAGTEVKKHLIDSLKANLDPISAKFEGIKNKYKGVEVDMPVKTSIGDKVAQLIDQEGYGLSPSSDQFKLIKTTLREVANVKDLEDLRKYQGILSDKTYGNPELRRVGGQLKGILRDAEDGLVTREIGADAPELMAEHQGARDAYKSSMSLIDNLNDRLHVGKYNGPGSFIKALGEMAPEDVLKRLSPKGDAGIIGELSQFPQVSDAIRGYHLDQALKVAANRAGENEVISTKTLFSQLDKLSPEMRNFLMPEATESKINAIRSLMNALPSRMNTSGTAKTLDLLWAHMPTSAGALASMLHGHNPVVGALLGYVGKVLGREVPDAVKLGVLKFLGSNKPIDAAGFKSMVDYAAAAVRGDMLTSRAVKAVFKPTTQLLPQYAMVTDSDRSKLDKRIKELDKDPGQLLRSDSDLAYYMPEHGTSLAASSSQAMSYLNSLRPLNTAKSPLDKPMAVSPEQKAKYNRALTLAQQPLSILESIQKGTITSADLVTFTKLYPSLYSKLSKNLLTEMNNHLSKKEPVPYSTRKGMSVFTGQAMDSTFSPLGISGAQPKSAGQPAQPGQEAKPKGTPSSPALQKASNQYRTPSDARAARMQRLK